MRWAYAILGVVVLGLFSIFVLFLFNDITISNEQDYYSLKEITEASMMEAVDVAYYRDTGHYKIVKEKFIENFTRRFAENQKLDNYTIEFYDIMEEPAKVTVKVNNNTNSYNIYGNSTSIKVVNEMSAILDTSENQTNGENACYIVKKLYSSPYRDAPSDDSPSKGVYTYDNELVKKIGYTPVEVKYVTSWRAASNNNIKEIKKYWNYYKTQFDSTYIYTPAGDEATSVTDNINAYANISVNSFYLQGNHLVYNINYECDGYLEAVVKGQTKKICELGIIYTIKYKKDSCN